MITVRRLVVEPISHRFVGVVFLAVTMAAILIGATPANAAEDDWVIEGGGWGHGIGLSQYGAYGMALEGFTSAEILAHYYSGATPVAASASLGPDHWIFQPEALWIGLEQDATTVDIEAVAGDLTVCQTGDGTNDCTVPDLVMGAGDTWRLEVVPASDPVMCRLVNPVDGTTLPDGDCSLDVTWVDNVNLDDPANATRVRVDHDREYAHGSLRIRPNDPNPAIVSGFHVALSIDLEEYLYGIAEVPASWPLATLEAQAMIARSYGVATAIARSPDGTMPDYRQRRCWCFLDASSIDQNYVGWSNESAGTDAIWGKRWVAAVDATREQVLTHPATGDAIIKTYYSSSTGGATENKEDIWGGTPLPYLRSVDDQWAVDPQVNNPYATWSKPVSPAALLAALDEGWDAVISARLVAGPPGTVVEFTGSSGGDVVTTTRTGNWFRFKFSVRSPYVSGVIAPSTVPPFTDITDSIHYASIAFIWQEGITKGCNPPDNTLFCSGGTVTRGQMAAFLTRALDLPGAGEDFFIDDGNSIFESDINRLAAAGITKGCNPPENDRFCPDGKVTRGQMAAFLVRAFGYTDPGQGDLFTDDDGLIFANDIDKLGTAGITLGCNPPDNTLFCPNDVLTRAQMATFLYRALN